MEVGLVEDGGSFHVIKMPPHCQPSTACPLVHHCSSQLERKFELKTESEHSKNGLCHLASLVHLQITFKLLSCQVFLQLDLVDFYQEEIGAVLPRLLNGMLVHQLNFHHVHTVVVRLQDLPGELHVQQKFKC